MARLLLDDRRLLFTVSLACGAVPGSRGLHPSTVMTVEGRLDALDVAIDGNPPGQIILVVVSDPVQKLLVVTVDGRLTSNARLVIGQRG